MTPRRLSPICLALLIALAALLPAGAPAAGSPARAWLTTGDRANLHAEQPAGALGAPMPDVPTISIDSGHSYQRIEGLGASITDSSAHLLARSPHRDEIMRSLFDPRAGLGLSYLPSRWAPRTSSRARTTPTTTSRRGRPTSHCGTSRSPTIGQRSCRCCARRGR
jgi:hypothetical protein